MAFSVVMPALEMAQETGKLLAWRKKEGDRVSKGEPLLEIETDKAVVEIEAPADGILAGIKASEGSDIPVGQTIAWIVAPGEAPPAMAETAAPSARAGSHTKPESPRAPAVTAAESRSSAKISPKARRLAKELGVDLATVRGSGPGGEIIASDIQAASSTSAAETTSDQIEKPTSFGSIMAERTTHSWTTVPHFFVTREIDATDLNAYRSGNNKDSSQPRITHTDL